MPDLATWLRHILAVLGVGMAGYSLYLLSLKKIHLGIVLPLIIGVGFVLYALCQPLISQFLDNHPIWHKAWQIGTLIFWGWVVSVLVFFGLIYRQTTLQTAHTSDFVAIIILGSKASNGIPSPALANRLDTAVAIAHTNPNAIIITTGGVGFGETISEADAAKAYLVQRHRLNGGQILSENQSTSTELNLKNSLPILHSRHINNSDSIAIVTSDFHTLRSQKIAQKQGLKNAVVIAAPTPLSTRYHAWLREYFAFISGFVLGEY